MSETKPANPRHSSAKENWGSPPWIVEAARKVMGSIDLDPASSAEANKIIRAGHYFTKSDDGLSRLWRLNSQEPHRLNVWLNPPGGKTDNGKSKVKLWWQKNLTQRSGPYFAQGMFLSFSIEACQVTQLGCDYSLLDFPTCFFKKRVDYLDPVTGQPVKGNTHSSCITYLPGRVNETHRFYETFQEFGKVTLGYVDHVNGLGQPVLNGNDFGGLGLPL